MREEFEKLPEIAAELENSDGELYWCDKQNQYRNNRVFQDSQTGWMNGAWYAWQAAKAKAVPEGFVLVPKEPSADLVNHGHQVFLGHFNEGGQTGGRSLYFAYKAMIEAQEQNQ